MLTKDNPVAPFALSARCSSFHKAFGTRPTYCQDMAPAMKSAMKSKAMKTNAKAMTKSQLADQLATKSELKKKEVLSVLQNLSEIGANEVTNTGKCPAGSLRIRFGLTSKQIFSSDLLDVRGLFCQGCA